MIVMLIFAIILKVSYVITGDFHPIFFTQKRIGKNGKDFKMYKFRTMIPDAEIKLKELLKEEPYKSQWKQNQKLDNDPRITKIGKLLRKTSLDELPQFINIYIGDMSIIGPRPLVKGELDDHNGNHAVYESVRPGITGWWACNGRSATTYDERLELEYYYINNRNFILDLKCIYHTIKAILFGKGAK
jgi:undecaprenyl-phosphate galactose phosphotransferase